MKKTPHRWFLVSLAHPALSTLGLILGSTNSGLLGYSAALLAFLFNLPGVLLIRQFYQAAVSEADADRYSIYFWMIVTTWLFVVVPGCYLISRVFSSRAVR